MEKIKMLGKYSNMLFIWNIVAVIAGIISAIGAIFCFLLLIADDLTSVTITTAFGLILIAVVAGAATIVMLVYRFLLGKINSNFLYSAFLIIALMAVAIIYYTIIFIMSMTTGVKQMPLAIIVIMVLGLLSTYYFIRGYREATACIAGSLSRGWHITWIVSMLGNTASIIGYIISTVTISQLKMLGGVINIIGCIIALVSWIMQIVFLKYTANICNNM